MSPLASTAVDLFIGVHPPEALTRPTGVSAGG